ETPPTKGKLQEVAVPAIINGRISAPDEEDRYRLLVKPGMQLRFEVFANRLGSPLDGTLGVFKAGTELASKDVRPGTAAPSVDLTVPDGVNSLVLSLKDVAGRGGSNYVYRLVIAPPERPDFNLTLLTERAQVPRGGYGIIRVRANRVAYGGAIRLSIPG